MDDAPTTELVAATDGIEAIEPSLPAGALAALETTLRSANGSGSGPRSVARRLGPLTSVLILGLVVTLGFLAGVEVQKRQGGTTRVATTATGATGAASRAGSGQASAGSRADTAGGRSDQVAAGAGRAGAATAGQVKLIDGTNIYVTDNQGNVVKVTTSDSSRLTRTGAGSITDIRPGDTVIVQGQKGADGVVIASAVADTGNASTG